MVDFKAISGFLCLEISGIIALIIDIMRQDVWSQKGDGCELNCLYFVCFGLWKELWKEYNNWSNGIMFQWNLNWIFICSN